MSNQEAAGQNFTSSEQNQNPALDQAITPMKIQDTIVLGQDRRHHSVLMVQITMIRL